MTIEEGLNRIEDAVMRTNRLLSSLFEEKQERQEKKNVQAYLNVRDASSLTGLSVNTLRQYCNSGMIRYTKVGKMIIIHTESLIAYINENSRRTIKELAAERLRTT